MFAAINTFLSGSAAQIKTQSFPPGTTSWTAPSDVSNLLTASGYGLDSYTATWQYGFFATNMLFPGTMTDTGWTDFSQLYSYYTSRLAVISAGAPTLRDFTSDVGTYFFYFNPATNTLWALQNGSGAFYVYGAVSSSWTLPTSGPMTTAINTNTVVGDITSPQYQTGGASNAFGKTFPGGVAGNPAPLTTYTNVAITPGATYSIYNNANSASLTISYYSAL